MMTCGPYNSANCHWAPKSQLAMEATGGAAGFSRWQRKAMGKSMGKS